LQRTITTSTDVEGMHIDRLDAQMPQNPFTVILSGNIPVQYRIWTHEVRLDAAVTPKRYKAY
jgi:serine protease inhibitor ecotin